MKNSDLFFRSNFREKNIAGKNFKASKSSTHEKGYIDFQAELQNFFGSRRDNDNTISFCGAVFFMRLDFNRRNFEFFLVCFFCGKIGNGGKKKFCSSKKNHADWSFVETCNDFYSFGSCGSHIDGTFFVNVGMFYCFLHDFARSSDLSRKGDFIEVRK